VNPLLALEDLGQSVWIDDIRRAWLRDGTLARLIAEDGVRGVTSNPAIFEKAITRHDDYAADIARLSRPSRSAPALYETLVVDDIRAAADQLRPVFASSAGRDGFVSLEVSPHLAHDTDATVSDAQRLWDAVARPNLMIKVPATTAGLPAIRRLAALGLNVNVTLLFSVSRYRAVADAYLSGLEDRLRDGHALGGGSASVASFFVSRIDTWVDARLDALATRQAAALRGTAAIGCARLAFQEFRRLLATPRWRALEDLGARPQRLLWASTGTKDRAYSDVRYVDALIGPDTVNTMPMATLDAFRDHGDPAVRVDAESEAAGALPAALAALGIDLDEMARDLELDGVRQFVEAHDRLLAALENAGRLSAAS
jgi:transaldolase